MNRKTIEIMLSSDGLYKIALLHKTSKSDCTAT